MAPLLRLDDEPKPDVYGCVTLRSSLLAPSVLSDSAAFSTALHGALQEWREKRIVRGVWFDVAIEHSSLIPLLVSLQFTFHHAQPDYVMMSRWLANSPNTLPKFAHTFIGCGGIVVDAEGRILMMREKKGIYLGWKFPGGLADSGETIPEAAEREVREETGVDAEVRAVLTFRHVTIAKWPGTGDIYFLCVMRPRDERNKEIKPCPHETAEAKWFTREEIDALPSAVFHSTLRDSIRKLEEWQRNGEKSIHFETVNTPFRPVPMQIFSAGMPEAKPASNI